MFAALMLLSNGAIAAKQDFIGTWTGTLSGLSIRVKIWNYITSEVEDLNAVMWIGDYYETVPVLGYKTTVDGLYLFRQADKAPFAMYRKNGVVYLEYWEALRTTITANSSEFNGTPARKIVMTKVPD